MIGREAIAALLPHGGAMVLLDRVTAWDAARIECRARSHLDPGNPLRRAGQLSAVCGLEYALQAAALHGALAAGRRPQPAGYVAVLRGAVLGADRLDDPAWGELRVAARLERGEGGGLIYALEVGALEVGALEIGSGERMLVAGRAVVALPRPA